MICSMYGLIVFFKASESIPLTLRAISRFSLLSPRKVPRAIILPPSSNTALVNWANSPGVSGTSAVKRIPGSRAPSNSKKYLKEICLCYDTHDFIVKHDRQPSNFVVCHNSGSFFNWCVFCHRDHIC